MMKSSPNLRTRQTLPRSPRRVALLTLAASALLLLLAACQQAGEPGVATDGSSAGVLGVYEFSFDGLGSDTVTASATRIDDGGVEPLSLGQGDIVTSGLSLAFITAGVETVDGENYVYGEFRVRYTEGSLTNLTFLGYQNVADNDGTAFQNPNAQSFRPTLGGPVAAVGTTLQLSDPDRLSLVVLDESDMTALETYVGGLGFATTAFPYGFVVSALDGSRSRTIGNGVDGVLRLGFKVPVGVTEINWRAVSVSVEEDDTFRLALPFEYSGRDVDGTDNLAAFLDEVVKVSEANGGVTVQATVIGNVSDVPGQRVLAATTEVGTSNAKDAFGDEAYVFRALDDVRVAGTAASPTVHWISGAADPNDDEASPVYLLETFTEPGPFTFETPFTSTSTSINAEYLVVAGGGGGGAGGADGAGGGGGAGGLREGTVEVSSAEVAGTVGAGGQGGVDGSRGNNGNPSEFGTVLTVGGGGGGGAVANQYAGSLGGSGGGGGALGAANSGAGGAGTPDEGNAGGSGNGTGGGQSANRSGGGGGGKGSPGLNAVNAIGGNGGGGTTSSITGFEIDYAGGGGGSARTGTAGTATAGGGAGAVGNATPSAGTDNTGGGGGGAANNTGGNGGSGIVIIRYSVTE